MPSIVRIVYHSSCFCPWNDLYVLNVILHSTHRSLWKYILTLISLQATRVIFEYLICRELAVSLHCMMFLFLLYFCIGMLIVCAYIMLLLYFLLILYILYPVYISRMCLNTRNWSVSSWQRYWVGHILTLSSYNICPYIHLILCLRHLGLRDSYVSYIYASWAWEFLCIRHLGLRD